MSEKIAETKVFVPAERPKPRNVAERVFMEHEDELALIDGFIYAAPGESEITVMVEKVSQLKQIPKEIEGVRFEARVGQRLVATTGVYSAAMQRRLGNQGRGR